MVDCRVCDRLDPLVENPRRRGDRTEKKGRWPGEFTADQFWVKKEKKSSYLDREGRRFSWMPFGGEWNVVREGSGKTIKTFSNLTGPIKTGNIFFSLLGRGGCSPRHFCSLCRREITRRSPLCKKGSVTFLEGKENGVHAADASRAKKGGVLTKEERVHGWLGGGKGGADDLVWERVRWSLGPRPWLPPYDGEE